MSDPNFPPTDPRSQGIAAGSSGGKYGFMQVVMSDKAARDFKDSMESIENSGKMGVYLQLIELVEKLTMFKGDPRIEQIMRFFSLYEKFWRAAASEDAAAIAEVLYAPENIAAMKEFAETMYDLRQGLINSEKFRNAFIVWLDESTRKYVLLGDAMTTWFDESTRKYTLAGEALVSYGDEMTSIGDGIIGEFRKMPALIVGDIKSGFKSALKDIDWEEIIIDIIEEHFD